MTDDKDGNFQNKNAKINLNEGSIDEDNRSDCSGHKLDKSQVPNIVVSVKNSDNLEEFSCKTYIQPEYIGKL
jgi:hypothetical protein